MLFLVVLLVVVFVKFFVFWRCKDRAFFRPGKGFFMGRYDTFFSHW